MSRAIIRDREERGNAVWGQIRWGIKSKGMIGIRDRIIREAKMSIKKIRNSLVDLEKSHNDIDVSKIGEALNALLNDLNQIPPETPPSTMFSSQYIAGILQHVNQSDHEPTTTLIDVTTNVVILGSKLHLVSVVEEVLLNPERRARGPVPKNKIGKSVQACFPSFKGFNLRVRQRQGYFDIIFEGKPSPSLNHKSDSPLKAFVPYLEPLLAWELRRYDRTEYYEILRQEDKLTINCLFPWRDPGDLTY